MEDESVTDVVNIEDVKVVKGDVTSRHNEISRKVFGFIEQPKEKLESKEPKGEVSPLSSLSSIYSSCDVVKTRIGICVLAGILFVIFFVLSPVDNLFSMLGVSGSSLLFVKGIAFCICLYILLYKLDICIS